MKLRFSIKLLFLCQISYAIAGPNGAVIVTPSGVEINGQGTGNVIINQNTNKAIINWQGFNVGNGESVIFNTPGANAATLNRIVSGNASQILGTVKSNGQLWLINPSGIMFGKNAQINVAGLVASTLNITDEDFIAGNNQFQQQGQTFSKIVNQGHIVSDHGYIALIAPQIENTGFVEAKLGTVAFGAGTKATLELQGNKLLRFEISEGANVPMFDSEGKSIAPLNLSGKIAADGGQVLLSAQSVNTILNQSINVGGIVQADTVETRPGKIILSAKGNAIVENASLSARGLSTDETGGTVKVIGRNVALVDNTSVNVSGAAGGGDMRIGYDNRDPIGLEAEITYIDATTSLKAEASRSGNGGFIETSGKYLEVFGAQVSTKAEKGKTGTWLLDPTNVTISNGATSNGSFSGGTFNYIGNPSTSNIQIGDVSTPGTLLHALANNNVAINTASAGAGLGNITISNAVTSASTNTLSLVANNNVMINAATNLAGNLTISAGGTITQSAALTVGGATTLTATGGDGSTLGIDLNNTSNNFNTINFSTTAAGAGVALADTNGISATGTTKGGAVSIVSNATNSGTGTLIVGSSGIDTTAAGTATDGASIYLTDSGTAGNGISLTGNLNGGDSANAQNNDLILTSQVGNITQSAGAITTRANGNNGFVVTTGGTGAINLNSGMNQILGGANLYFTTAGGDIILNNSAAADNVGDVISLNIKASNSDGSSRGNITLTGSGAGLSMSIYDVGDADGASLNVQNQNGNIYLNNNNDGFNFTGDISVNSGGDLSINQLLDTSAGNISLTGGSVSLNNNVSLSTIAGKTLTIAGPQGGDGTGAINTLGSVQFNNGNNSDLALNWTTTAAQNLGITFSGTGNLTQITALNVTGATTLDLGSGNNATLSNAGNNFSTVAIASGNNVTLRDTNAVVLGTSTTNGSLNITAAGAITQSGALSTAGGSFNAGSNPITLTNTSNNFGNSAVSLTGTTTQISDNNATGLTLGAVSAGTLTGTATHGLTVNSSGITTSAGNISLTANNGIAANTGVLNIAGNINAGTNSITLFNDSTAFATTADAITQSAGTITQTSLTKTITLGVKSGKITQTGGNIVSAGTVKLSNRLGTIGAITLDQSSNNFNSISAVSFVNDLLAGLTVKDVNGLAIGLFKSSGPVSVTANTTTTNTGSLLLSGTIDATGQSVNLTNSSTAGTGTMLDIGVNLLANDLTLATASGNVVATGAITATGTTTLSGNNITLDNSANNFGTIGITSANNVNLRDAGALVLGASTVNGTLDITTAGAITQSSAIVVTGTTSLTAGSANNITLNNTSNNFSTVGITSGNNVSLTDTNALVLGASTVSGTLSVTTGAGGNVNGALTQSGALDVTGTSSFTNNSTSLTAADKNITLTNIGNNFSTAALSAGNNVSLVDSNALILDTSTVLGNLTMTTAGAITQSGALAVTGTTTLAAGSGNNITLGNASNNFGAVGITSGNNVSLRDAGAIDLSASTVSGTLGITTAGAITQSGALTVTGATTLAAGSGNDITLNNASNNFGTVGITSGNNVNLRDSNALNLAASTVSGTFDVTTSGALTQSGVLTVSGITTLAAGSANNITLNDVSNNFTTVGVTSGNNISLIDTNALTLGSITSAGNLAVTTGGALTISGAVNAGNNTLNLMASSGGISGSGSISATGGTTLDANAGTITLSNASNHFGLGVVTVGHASTTSGAVNLGVDNGGIQLAQASGSTLGLLTLSSDNGAITQSGALNVTGATFNSSSTGIGTPGNITLTNASNDFGNQSVALTGNTVQIADANTTGLNLGTVNSGALTASATHGLTVSSAGTTAAGNVSLTANNGAASNTGILNIAGTFNAGANTVNLINTSTAFSTSNDAITLTGGTLTAGTLNIITASGKITQSGGNVVASGTTTLTNSGTTIGAISLNQSGNNFSTVTSSGNLSALTIQDSDALILGAINANGLNVTAGGNLTQSGVLAISGTTNINTGTHDITLSNASNHFNNQTVTLTGGTVQIIDANVTGLNLGAVNASGNLSITSSNTINQSSAMAVAGTTTINAGTGDINLTNSGNNFGNQVVTLTGGIIQLVDQNTSGLTLGNISGSNPNVTVSSANTMTLTGGLNAGTGNVSLTSSAGGITESGAGTISASSVTLNASGSSNNITLDGNNTFNMLTASGNNISFTNTTALVLGPTTAGNLDINLNNASITQTGPLNVSGTSAFDLGTGNLNLTNNGNNLAGAVSATGGTIQIIQPGNLIIGQITASGTATISSTGGTVNFVSGPPPGQPLTNIPPSNTSSTTTTTDINFLQNSSTVLVSNPSILDQNIEAALPLLQNRNQILKPFTQETIKLIANGVNPNLSSVECSGADNHCK